MAEQLLSTAVHDTLPGSYVRPESQRPRLAEVVTGARIPVVDLGCPDRAAVVAAIGDSCRSHGFFQVLNHGIHAALIASVMAVGRDFFRLPPEEKAKLYSDDPARKIRLSTSFNVRKETTVHNWRDYLRHPLDQSVPDVADEYIANTMRTYKKEVGELGFWLHTAISDSLGLEVTNMKQQTLGGDQEQHVAVNLYPQRPEPELNSGGLPAHTGPFALTVFLTDHNVASLQVLQGGRWVAVNPSPGALVVGIGDQLHDLAKREPGARPRLGENRAAALGQQVPDTDGVVPVRALLCYSDGHVLPLESVVAAGETFVRSSDAVPVQVRVDGSMGAKACDPIVLGGVRAKATSENDGRNNGRHGSRDNLLGTLGIMAASLAVTAAVPAAAGAITPAMAIGAAVLLFTGVSMAMASIRGA